MSQRNQDRTSRRNFLKYSSTALAAGFIGLGLRAGAEANHHHADVDQPNQHNMLIVGQEAVFLSHLPMFSEPGFISPHRYQVILEATLTRAGTDLQSVYTSDRKKNPATKIYTLSPDNFILPTLNPVNGQAVSSSFTARIFRGHFERPGKRLLLRDVNIGVKNVVHFREFTPQATNSSQLEYILFGKGKELFLAHFITRPPDFDQVLSVSAAGHTFTDQELGKGMRVVFERPNSMTQRLTEKQEALGEVRNADATAAPLKVNFKAATEFYFEEGELRIPADFDTTSLERKAGFP